MLLRLDDCVNSPDLKIALKASDLARDYIKKIETASLQIEFFLLFQKIFLQLFDYSEMSEQLLAFTLQSIKTANYEALQQIEFLVFCEFNYESSSVLLDHICTQNAVPLLHFVQFLNKALSSEVMVLLSANSVQEQIAEAPVELQTKYCNALNRFLVARQADVLQFEVFQRLADHCVWFPTL